jgi:hypothetical protein
MEFGAENKGIRGIGLNKKTSSRFFLEKQITSLTLSHRTLIRAYRAQTERYVHPQQLFSMTNYSRSHTRRIRICRFRRVLNS